MSDTPTNPFDDDEVRHHVLVNAENRYSLWPVFADVPAGWTIAHADDTRQSCIDHANTHWADIRPAGPLAQPSTS